MKDADVATSIGGSGGGGVSSVKPVVHTLCIKVCYVVMVTLSACDFKHSGKKRRLALLI